VFTIELFFFRCKPRFEFAELKSLSSNGIRGLEVLRKHLSYSSFAFLTLREFCLKLAHAVLVMLLLFAHAFLVLLLLFAHAILVVSLSLVQAFCEFALGGVGGRELLDQDIVLINCLR
jgi:hypothetical protein